MSAVSEQSGHGSSDAAGPTNPMHTSIILDNNTSGFLRRQGNIAIGTGLHRKRYYRLDGSVLSKQATEHSPATWHANILGAEIAQHSKLCFSIFLKNVEHEDDARLVLYAKTEGCCHRWVECLQNAATRSLEKHYQIGEQIGEGGFASVRLGKCRKTGRVVAVKTIRKEKEFMTLYGREIAVIKRVDHDNIVKTFDLFETDKKIHIVMEYMAGGMLFEAIEDGIAFNEADVAQLMREVLHGIMYLHDNGVVHRDMKPENVLCTDSHPPWHVKIADFGLSKFTEKGAPSADMLMKTMIGTPEFIAPEIANRLEYTSKVDIWAVGMLMYNVVAGKLPFEDGEVDFIGKLRRGLKLNFPEEAWRSFSPDARSFTRALLCPDPEKRLTALAALVHPWLDNELRFGSSRFSSHGRFSRQVVASSDGFDAPALTRGRKSCFFLGKNKKPSWLVAFLAVRAMNRFLLLVRPPAQIELKAHQRKTGERLSGTTNIDEEDSEDSCPDFSPTSIKSTLHEGKDTDSGSHTGSFDSHSGHRAISSLASKLSHLHSPLHGPLHSPLHGAATESGTPSPRGTTSATRLLSVAPRKASGLLAGPMRKASGISSLLKAKEAGAPSRKGSFRNLFKGNAHANDTQSATSAASEFDQLLGLGDLGLQNVDDFGNESNDDDFDSDGPASFMGRKHMKMMKQSTPTKASLLSGSVSPLAGNSPLACSSPLASKKNQNRVSFAQGSRGNTGYKSRLQGNSALAQGSIMAKKGKGSASSNLTGPTYPLARSPENESNSSNSSKSLL